VKSLICKGGKKRSNGYFGYIENNTFLIGCRHYPLSKIDRYRFFNTRSRDFSQHLYSRNYLKII
jgi:hypothetical protein